MVTLMLVAAEEARTPFFPITDSLQIPLNSTLNACMCTVIISNYTAIDYRCGMSALAQALFFNF